MKRQLLLLAFILCTIGLSAQSATRYFVATHCQTFDPDPWKEGNWRVGALEELQEPLEIEWTKNFVRIAGEYYFIDKSSQQDANYTEDDNANFHKSTSFTAQKSVGTQIYLCIEYAHRKDNRIFGFSLFEQNRQGHFYLAQRIKKQ